MKTGVCSKNLNFFFFFLREWFWSQRHRWTVALRPPQWPLGDRLDRENHYSQRLREFRAQAPPAGRGQEREELIVGSGPDVSQGVILSGFCEGMVGKISSQAWGCNAAEVKMLSLVWPKLCSLDQQTWSFILKTVWCWPGPDVLREESRCQCVQRWRGLVERRQVSHGAIRWDKASVNSGKRHIKEMKLLCGSTTVFCNLPPFQPWRPPSPSLPASSTQHLCIRITKTLAWLFPTGAGLHSHYRSALGPDNIVPGT